MGRRTVARTVTLTGRGLHTGARVRVDLTPGSPRAGVRFHRSDRAGDDWIPAEAERVVASEWRTALGPAGDEGGEGGVATVEHLLAAVVACGLTDLDVRLDGPELPALDGSAAPFADAIRRAGTMDLPGPVTPLVVNTTFEVVSHDARYTVRPAIAPRYRVTIEWDHPAIGRQEATGSPGTETFIREILPARTFGFLHDAEALRARGFALGANRSCAVIFTDTGIMDGGGLRWPDECARHKLLDLTGDLALLGRPVIGEITADRPGHRGNLALVRALEARLTGD